MSNPSDPSDPSGPYGQGPYGQGPFGQTPYEPYGARQPAPTDAVSITAFVLSLTGCLSLIGLVLGIVGIRRTRNGVRKGRWAAVAGTVIGALGTLAAAGLIVALVLVVQSSVTPDDAEVGQCVDVDENDDGETTLQEKECGEDHDAQVVAVGVAGEVGGLSRSVDPVEACLDAMAPADVTALQATSQQLVFSLLVEDPDDIANDDPFLCYVEPSSGELDGSLLG